MKGVYTTGNLICSECGRFLQPELVRNASGAATGEILVRGHQASCSLFGTASILKLPFIPIDRSVREKAA
jgi:hypothetical protein